MNKNSAHIYIKIFMLCALFSTPKIGATLRDLYDIVLDTTDGQILRRTERIEKKFKQLGARYSGAGGGLAQNIQKYATEVFQRLQKEEQARAEELKRAQEEVKIAQQRTQELQKELESRAVEVQKEESKKTEQAHQVLVKEKDDLTAINKLLQDRVTELEDGYQKYLKELAEQINAIEPE